MGEGDIPQEVRAFLAEHVDSVLRLEVLLWLRSHRDRGWTADQIGKEFRIDPSWASGQLQVLMLAGILARGAGPESEAAYQYAPHNPALDATITAVDEAYATRRVTIIGLIFSEPPSPLRSFADAFRLRKDKDKHDG